MPCYYPLNAYYGRYKNGKRSITFHPSDAINRHENLKLPCGQCIGCRLDKARSWALRCYHEAKLHSKNCFITLTYDDSHLPPSGSLVKSDFQKFMKRLRKEIGYVRFFHCGEYGSQLQRPHYHACLFGYDFPDKTLWSVKGDVQLYRSRLLEKLWTFGYSTVGAVTFDSAAYVARYITKKITGEASAIHYKGKNPEYITMSRRPGIGKDFVLKYASDIYPHDYAIIKGSFKVKPPRYYDAIYDLTNHEMLTKIKEKRVVHAKSNTDNTPSRLRTKEFVALQRLKTLKRQVEDGTSSLQRVG